MNKKETNPKQYRISVNGTPIEVSEEVYLCYYRARRRMRYYEWDIKTETPIRDKNGNITGYAPGKEDSLERLTAHGMDFADEHEPVEDTVVHRLMSDKLHWALDKLSEDERKLTVELFLSDGSVVPERDYSAKSGIPQKTINDRKHRILKKLKKILGN